MQKLSKNTIATLEDLLCYQFQRSSSGLWIIDGPPDSGKTNSGMYWAEVTHERNMFLEGMIASNVYMLEGESSFINHIYDLDTFRSWCEANKRTPKLYILDEAAQSFPKRTPMSKQNIEMLSEIQTLRHYYVFIILITQDPEKYLDSGLLNPTFLQGKLHKLYYRKHGHYEFIDMIQPELSCYNNDFPPTTIPYDPHHVAPFVQHAPLMVDFQKPDWLQRALSYKTPQATTKAVWGSYRKQKERDIKKALSLLDELLGKNNDRIKALLEGSDSDNVTNPT